MNFPENYLEILKSGKYLRRKIWPKDMCYYWNKDNQRIYFYSKLGEKFYDIEENLEILQSHKDWEVTE